MQRFSLGEKNSLLTLSTLYDGLRVHAQARECVSTIDRIWWVVGGLNFGLNLSIKVSETHPLGKIYNPDMISGRRQYYYTIA